MFQSKKQIKKYNDWLQAKDTNYYPWIKVSDFSSEGESSIIRGFSSRRNHHCFSNIELATLLYLDWRCDVTDIKDQYALDPIVTNEIAFEAKIKPPAINGELQIMSTDLVVSTSGNVPQIAFQNKHSSELKEKRVIEKLEIDRRYWVRKKVPWYLITEKDIPEILIKNVMWLQSTLCDVTKIENLDEKLKQFLMFSKQVDHNDSVIDFTKHIDSAYELSIGESLSEIRQLIAWRYVHVDLTKNFRQLTVKEFVEGAEMLKGGGNAVTCK